jgi:uncharacterized membrane protein YbaN (DUF454 family)
MIKSFVREWKAKNGKHRMYMVGGAIFFVLALVGVAVPVIPQVPFAIIAALLFAKGSARFHFKIRHNKFFGKPVRDWEDHQVVRTKLKLFSTIAMIGGAAMAYWKLEGTATIVISALFAASIAFIWTRKSKPYKFLPD